MSLHEGVEVSLPARKPGGALLVFLPLLIAILGGAAIYLGQLSGSASGGTGYGIDERITGSIAPAGIIDINE